VAGRGAEEVHFHRQKYSNVRVLNGQRAKPSLHLPIGWGRCSEEFFEANTGYSGTMSLFPYD